MNVLGVAVCLLAALTLLNLFVLLGVVRRLREVSLARSEADARLPAVGSAVSRFSAPTVDGGVVTDADLRDGPALAVFLSPSCPPCRETAKALGRQTRPLPARTFVFVHAHRDEPALPPLLHSLGGVGTVALDEEHGPVAAAFGVTGYPMAVMVDGGLVTAASPDHTELPAAQEALAR